MPSVLIHGADESVTISPSVAKRLVEKGSGDAALLYIALLRRHGAVPPGPWPASCGGKKAALRVRRPFSGSWDCWPRRSFPSRRTKNRSTSALISSSGWTEARSSGC